MSHVARADSIVQSGHWLGATSTPSCRGFIALLEAFRATRGTAPAEVVNRMLDENQCGSTNHIGTLIDTGQIFGFEWSDSLWIPMFQFETDDLILNVGAQSVRSELPISWSGWRIASWFAAPYAQLDGHIPADMLREDLEAVLRLARSTESINEISPPLMKPAQQTPVHV
jgi:hypothetical protein